MADTGLNVAELIRRLAVKGGTKAFELVPGVFPTVQLGDYEDLVGGPKIAFGMSGYEISVPASQSSEMWVSAKVPTRILGLYFGANFANNVRYYLYAANRAELPATLGRENLGDLPLANLGSGEQPSTSIGSATPFMIGGVFGAGGTNAFQCHLEPGESLSLCAYNQGVAASFVTLSMTWAERPAGTVDP